MCSHSWERKQAQGGITADQGVGGIFQVMCLGPNPDFCGHGPRDRPDWEGPMGGWTEGWAREEAWMLRAWPGPFLAPQTSCP